MMEGRGIRTGHRDQTFDWEGSGGDSTNVGMRIDMSVTKKSNGLVVMVDRELRST